MATTIKVTDYESVKPKDEDILLLNQGGENKNTTVQKLLENVNTKIGDIDVSSDGDVATQLNEMANDKFDKANVANNLATTEEGFALDARQGKTLNDKIDDNSKKLVNSSNTLTNFTELISDMLNGNFSVTNVQGSAMSNSPTASSNEMCWFCVITFGVVNRCTQIAIQCFMNSFKGKMYIRYQHDTKVSAWQALN